MGVRYKGSRQTHVHVPTVLATATTTTTTTTATTQTVISERAMSIIWSKMMHVQQLVVKYVAGSSD